VREGAGPLTGAKPDPGFVAEARAEAVRVMADAALRALARFRYVPAGLIPRAFVEAAAVRQLDALLRLPAPTRAALLESPRAPG
jgi:hypothetical protein